MFIKLSDADLDATSAKAEIKYEIYIVSSCINAVCVCVCVCVCACARACVCVCVVAAVWDLTGFFVSQLLEKQMCEGCNAVS